MRLHWSGPVGSWVAVAVAACLLSACGGGDGISQTDDGEVRYYQSIAWNNRTLGLMSFESGLTYGFYQSQISSPRPPDFAYAGFFVLHAGTEFPFKSLVGYNYNFETGSRTPATLQNITLNDKVFLSTFSTAGTSMDMGAYRALVDMLPTDTSVLPGKYHVQARALAKSVKTVASINSSGQLQMNLDGGCDLRIQFNARPRGNLYTVSATMDNHCVFGRGSFSGHASQNGHIRNVYVFLVNQDGDGIMLLLSPA